jgi:hypothetical protein
VLFLFGCAGRGPLVVTDRPLPDIRLSPEIQLLDVPVRKISAAFDQYGRVHVLALASKPPELHYLVVGTEGVLNREVVTSVDSHDHLDITFDGSGNLHAIVNEDHFVLENGTWHTLPKDPCRKLIRGGQDLFCAFQVEGKDIDVLGDWDLYTVPVYGPCCLLFPWYSYPDKLVVARKTSAGWSEWTVCDAETRFDIDTFSIASDNSGTVHLLYRVAEGGSSRELQCRYARIQPRISEETSENKQVYHSDLVEVPYTLAKLSGQFITTGLMLDCQDIAVDPETGTALIIIKKHRYGDWGFPLPQKSYSYIYEDGKFGGPVMMYDFDRVIHVEPAGDGLFLSLGVWSGDITHFIYYLEYRDGMWSAPLLLGTGRSDNVVLVSDLNRRAFALWTNNNDRPVARWIER